MISKKRRGQITLFIIVGIFILLGVGVYMYYLDEYYDNDHIYLEDNSETEIVTFVESCLQYSTQMGVYFTSLQGGYFLTPSPYTEEFMLRIPVYKSTNNITIQSLENMSDEIESFVDKATLNCLTNNNSLKIMGKNITYNNISSTVFILNNSVSVALDLNTTIIGDNSSQKIESYFVEFDSSLFNVYSAIKEYLEYQETKKDWIRFTKLVDIGEKYGIRTAYARENSTEYDRVIFVFEDENENIDYFGSYQYVFALEYDW